MPCRAKKGILSMRYSFHGGIRVHSHMSEPIVTTWLPTDIILNINENYTLKTEAGAKVYPGSILAECDDGMPVFSPVCGSVLEAGEGKIRIEASAEDNEAESESVPSTFPDFASIETPLSETAPEVLCDMMRRASVATPSCPDGAFALCNTVRAYEGTRRVIIDCTSAEDNLFTNRYIVQKLSDKLLGGIKILIRACGAIGAVIITDEGHIPTIRRLEKLIDGRLTALVVSEAKYPIADPKLLMHAVLRKECPPDKAPSDFGCAVLDAEACVAVYDAIVSGTPMTHRTLSLSYEKKRYILIAPIGAPVSDVADKYCDGAKYISYGSYKDIVNTEESPSEVISSRERMINARKRVRARRSLTCIRCMRCEDVCPMYLSPYKLLMANRSEKKLASLGADCCIHCNCCSAVCPSGIDIPAHFTPKEENDG